MVRILDVLVGFRNADSGHTFARIGFGGEATNYEICSPIDVFPGAFQGLANLIAISRFGLVSKVNF
jgi:hypothetical protein